MGDSRSGRLCQRTFDRRCGFALELFLGGDVVVEFSIVFKGHEQEAAILNSERVDAVSAIARIIKNY